MLKRIHYLLYIFLLGYLLAGCTRHDERRRIRLSEATTQTRTEDQLSTTIHLEPALSRAIAVMFFENETGDENLEWLRQGLTEMFIRALSQSQQLNVLSTDRMIEILERLGHSDVPDNVDVDMAAVVAREANVEALITGNLSKRGDTLRIDVKLHEPEGGEILKAQSVEGPGLEHIFSMVDQLTSNLKTDLQLTFDRDEPSRNIAEMSTNSLEAWRHYTNGIELLDQMLVNEALASFEEAVSYDTTFISAYINLAEVYVATQNISMLTEVLAKLNNLRYKATDRELYKMDFWRALARGDLNDAIASTETWLEAHPEDLDARYWMGNIFLGTGNFSRSAEQYDAILRFDPKNRLAHNMKGYSHAYQGDYDKAIESLKTYAELAPEEPNPFDSLGEVYRFMGDMKNSIANYKRSIEVNENMVASYIGLGNSYMDAGMFAKAQEAYEQYYDRVMDRGTLRDAYRSLAYSNWKLGRAQESITNFMKSMDLDDHLYTSIRVLHEIADDLGVVPEFESFVPQTYQTIRSLLNSNPNGPKALGDLSMFYELKTKETLDILEELEKTTENNTVRMWSRMYIGLLQLYEVRYDSFMDNKQRFIDGCKAFIRTSGDIYSYFTWRALMRLNDWAVEHEAEGYAIYDELIDYAESTGISRPENYLRLCRADLQARLGDKRSTRSLNSLGFPAEHKWMIIGSFEHRNGFSRIYRPEKDQRLSKTHRGKQGKVAWNHFKDDYHEGYVDLKTSLPDNNWSVGYAMIYVEASDSIDVQFRLGSNETIQVWLNNADVFRLNVFRTAVLDNNIIPVTLQPGLNKILIKICNRIGEWGFFFRITDYYGKGLNDLRFISPDEIPLPS